MAAGKLETATVRPERRPPDDTPLSRPGSVRYELEPRDGGTDGEDKHENQEEEKEGEKEGQQYMFHMPDLGFFTPWRVVLAIGRMRMLPSLE